MTMLESLAVALFIMFMVFILLVVIYSLIVFMSYLIRSFEQIYRSNKDQQVK